MINWIKHLWRKLFRVKTGAYDSDLINQALVRKWARMGNREPEDYNPIARELLWLKSRQSNITSNDNKERIPYDPSQDPERIMKGLEESYFD